MNRAMRRHHSREFLGQRGVAALEFAFVLPVLLLMAFGIIDFGRAVWTQAALDYAVQYAARCAALGSINCPDPAQYAADSTIAVPNVKKGDFSVTDSTCGTGVNGVRVSAIYRFSYIFPAFAPYSGPLTATACFPI